MTELTYPPTPWKAFIEEDGTYCIDHDANGSVCLGITSREAAERIVKCVNARENVRALVEDLEPDERADLLIELGAQTRDIHRDSLMGLFDRDAAEVTPPDECSQTRPDTPPESSDRS